MQQLRHRRPLDDSTLTAEVIANYRIGNDLMAQEHAQEALEEHYLPYGKPWLDRAVDTKASSREAHDCQVTHLLVGRAELKLNRPAKALTEFEKSKQWGKLLIDREPNEPVTPAIGAKSIQESGPPRSPWDDLTKA